MIALGSLSTIIHIIAGSLTLIAGPIAIFSNNRNTPLHRIAGKIFFIAMNIVCISAIIGFFKRSDEVFFQFLLGIAVSVYGFILRGVRFIQLMKGDTVKTFDWIYTAVMAVCGATMVSLGVWHLIKGNNIAFPILFGVFGSTILHSVYENYKFFSQPEKVAKLEWLRLHVLTMIGALISSTTAFTVNTATYLPWYIQWFGPTLVLLPLQFYWGRKLKKQMKIA
jgi:hypothetical protein